jgi:amidase
MMPAARAGLYALKITRGTVNDTGVQPALRHFDCLGGFTRNAVDQAHLVAIMQERSPDTYLPLKKSWEGLKIGFVDPTKWRSYPAAMESIESYFQQTDAAMFAAADKIRSEGGKVVHSIPMPSWDEITGAMPSMNDMEDLNRKFSMRLRSNFKLT